MLVCPRARRRYFGAAWRRGDGAWSLRGVAGVITKKCGVSRRSSFFVVYIPPSPVSAVVCTGAARRAALAGAGEGASVTGVFNDIIGVVECESGASRSSSAKGHRWGGTGNTATSLAGLRWDCGRGRRGAGTRRNRGVRMHANEHTNTR